MGGVDHEMTTDSGRALSVVVRILVPVLVVAAVILAAWLLLRGQSLPEATGSLGTPASPAATYDPVLAGEPLPQGYRQLLPRDAILPVYEPEFVTAAEAPWVAETLVIGVALAGEARAYPISYLNAREMVVDSIAGIPVLVTW